MKRYYDKNKEKRNEYQRLYSEKKAAEGMPADGTAAALRIGGVLAALGNLGSEVPGTFRECITI